MAVTASSAKIKVILETEAAIQKLKTLEQEQTRLDRMREQAKREEQEFERAEKPKKEKLNLFAQRFNIHLPDIEHLPARVAAEAATALLPDVIGRPVGEAIKGGVPLLEMGTPAVQGFINAFAKGASDNPEFREKVREILDATLGQMSSTITELKAFKDSLQPALDQLFTLTKGQLLLGQTPSPTGSLTYLKDIFDWERNQNRLRKQIRKDTYEAMGATVADFFIDRTPD